MNDIFYKIENFDDNGYKSTAIQLSCDMDSCDTNFVVEDNLDSILNELGCFEMMEKAYQVDTENGVDIDELEKKMVEAAKEEGYYLVRGNW